MRRGGDARQGPRRAARRPRDVTDLAWRCACVGSLDRAPAFADHVQRRALAGGLRDRVHFAGPRTGAALDSAYAAADLLVLASHGETYGMVVTEALARGVPVLATDVGGVPEALGHGGLLSSRPATRRPSAPRCAAGSRTPISAARSGGPRGSGARACAAGRTPPRPWPPRSWRRPGRRGGGGDERDRRLASARSGSSCASRPTPRRARASSWSELAAPPPRGRPARHPRPRRRQRRDGPVAGSAAAAPAALGHARPGRGPAGARGRRSPGRGHRRGAAVRHHAARAGRPRRREPRRRLRAARHADRGRAAPDARRVQRAPHPDRDDRHRSRRASRRPSRSTRRSAWRSTRTSAATAGSARTRLPPRSTRWAARSLVRPSPWHLGPDHAELMAAWFGGWVDAACEKEPELASEAGPYRERRLAQAPPGSAAPSITPTCWCCRDDETVGAPRRRRDARASWSGAWGPARSSTGCARSTAARSRPRRASRC